MNGRRWPDGLRRPKTAQALALRARMILACAEGCPNIEVAAELGVSNETVGKWRTRFVARGLDGLSDEPPSGRPRTVTDDNVDQVFTLTLETTPEDATHWSTRGLTRRTGLSHSTIGRIWRAFGLQPHRTGTFKLSERSLLHGEGAGQCGSLSRSSRAGTSAVRGREIADPGPGSDPAPVAHAPGPDGTAPT